MGKNTNGSGNTRSAPTTKLKTGHSAVKPNPNGNRAERRAADKEDKKKSK
jgi:hypothetical protein